jgi:hypothetical protein
MIQQRDCLLRLAGAIATGIACLAGAAAEAAPVQFDLAGAWGGWSRPGRVTEAELLLQSPERTRATITLAAGTQVVRTQVQLVPGEPARLAVPMPATERIVVTLAPDGMTAQQRELSLSFAETPLLAWVAPARAPHSIDGFHVVEIDAIALPENGAAYGSIDALVVDRTVLGALTEHQLSALLSFMANCGRTLLISDTPAAGGLLHGAVGCGGRNFAEAGTADAALARLAGMLDAGSTHTPHPTALGALGGHTLGPWSLAAAVLALGLTAIALAGILSRSLLAVLGVPALVAVAGLLFMQSRPQDTQLLVWAESRSSDGVAQYRGMQLAVASRRGDFEVPVPAVLAEPQACNARGSAEWAWDTHERRYLSARFAGRLFATAALCFGGSFPVTRDAVANADADGEIGLRNAGPAAWPAGTFIRDHRVHALPALAAGASLASRAGPGAEPATAAERLAVARTPFDGLGLLWPLDLRGINQASRGAQAWLLLQVPVAATGQVPR